MKMKKFNKLISDFMTWLMAFTMFMNTYVLASDNFANTTVGHILTDITSVLLTVAGLVCVGKLIHIGILYMTSSAAEKSNAKSAALPWLIGTIVCFAAATIGKAIINIIGGDLMNKDVLEY